MTHFIEWLKSTQGRIVVLSVVLVFVLPLVGSKVFHLPQAIRLGVFFILINMVLAILFGRWINNSHSHWLNSLIMPAIFSVLVYFFYANYNYWFAPIYWLLTMLADTGWLVSGGGPFDTQPRRGRGLFWRRGSKSSKP